jgi:HEAT repeat protein
MTTSQEILVSQIRDLLDRLVACRRLDNEGQEVVCDAVTVEARALPREGVLEALDKAIGSNRKRRKEAVYILSELTDVPEAVSRIAQSLKDPDPEWRSWLIQTVRMRGMRQFAALLNDIIECDPDPFCRELAIAAAGTLQQKVNLPILFRLADEEPELTWCLVVALQSHATEECRPHLQRWFQDETQEKSTRVFAAWGLGKLADEKAIDFLIAVLDDPGIHAANSFKPGESIRAAQALCDIYGWPFKWDKSFVEKTIANVKERGR